ncbi:hypothetical protein J8J14_19260 [Roseomonas sp. SSH11]|uniref:Uncharacterized protein n=1 Tax=Pararoseomonas baculiformis TaxID=2820812 RepID=A0ABS4AKA5_9PROT|nr:hypothetical protein [Pararoseomonas baculiformis]MBP0446918.1 hypothetical protein [Pararoseomonas baculiformis]
MASIPDSPGSGDAAGAGRGVAAAGSDEMLRQTVLNSVRISLKEGARKAADPVAYLRAASEEVARVVAVLAHARPEDGAALRAILAEAVVAAAGELIDGCGPQGVAR